MRVELYNKDGKKSIIFDRDGFYIKFYATERKKGIGVEVYGNVYIEDFDFKGKAHAEKNFVKTEVFGGKPIIRFTCKEEKK